MATYLALGGSLEATARSCSVHATVRYRLGRVSEQVGWDATDPRDGLMLHMAAAISRLIDSMAEDAAVSTGSQPSVGSCRSAGPDGGRHVPAAAPPPDRAEVEALMADMPIDTTVVTEITAEAGGRPRFASTGSRASSTTSTSTPWPAHHRQFQVEERLGGPWTTP